MHNTARFAQGHVAVCFASAFIALMFALLLQAPRAEAQEVAPPVFSEATCAALIDQGGNIVYQQNQERHMSLASITKVMTAMCVLDSGISLDEVVPLMTPTLDEDSQMAGYTEGDKASVRELLQVMLVYSANDAAHNLAVRVAGSIESFSDIMNKKAAEIGMSNSHFVNPHGLEDDNHYSCAIDLARMGKYALENYPFIAQTITMRSVKTTAHGEPIELFSTDDFLDSYSGARGIKTGAVITNYTFLGAAGHGNKQLYSAVLGCTSATGRFADTITLMDWGFARYRDMQISDASWVLRAQPYAYDFGQRAIVSSPKDSYASVRSKGGDASYVNVMSRSNRLLEAGSVYGWSHWTQSGTNMGTALYATRSKPMHVSSWPLFSLPLFADLNQPDGSDANA